MLKSSKAFTLTEIILTLVIIGVIVAITIPLLATNIQKHSGYAGLLRALSMLTQAATSIRNKNDGNFSGLISSSSDDTNLDMAILFKDKLKTKHLCSDLSCYNVENIKTLNGETYAVSLLNFPKIVTNDNFVYAFIMNDTNCNSSIYTRKGNAEGCGQVYVDINGIKPPNTLGKDIFIYSVNKYNVAPAGSDENNNWENNCDINSTASANGSECAGRAIAESKINYF